MYLLNDIMIKGVHKLFHFEFDSTHVIIMIWLKFILLAGRTAWMAMVQPVKITPLFQKPQEKHVYQLRVDFE